MDWLLGSRPFHFEIVTIGVTQTTVKSTVSALNPRVISPSQAFLYLHLVHAQCFETKICLCFMSQALSLITIAMITRYHLTSCNLYLALPTSVLSGRTAKEQTFSPLLILEIVFEVRTPEWDPQPHLPVTETEKCFSFYAGTKKISAL